MIRFILIISISASAWSPVHEYDSMADCQKGRETYFSTSLHGRTYCMEVRS
jgi:hypothetical protein